MAQLLRCIASIMRSALCFLFCTLFFGSACNSETVEHPQGGATETTSQDDPCEKQESYLQESYLGVSEKPIEQLAGMEGQNHGWVELFSAPERPLFVYYRDGYDSTFWPQWATDVGERTFSPVLGDHKKIVERERLWKNPERGKPLYYLKDRQGVIIDMLKKSLRSEQEFENAMAQTGNLLFGPNAGLNLTYYGSQFTSDDPAQRLKYTQVRYLMFLGTIFYLEIFDHEKVDYDPSAMVMKMSHFLNTRQVGGIGSEYFCGGWSGTEISQCTEGLAAAGLTCWSVNKNSGNQRVHVQSIVCDQPHEPFSQWLGAPKKNTGDWQWLIRTRYISDAT